jgi:hypothetical protein
VQCVHSGQNHGTSVQLVRSGRFSGLLLIRGFGVQVPGGAPVLTWCFSALAALSGRWRGTSWSAASLHTVHTQHIRTARLITLSSHRSSWRRAHRRLVLRSYALVDGPPLDKPYGTLWRYGVIVPLC